MYVLPYPVSLIYVGERMNITYNMGSVTNLINKKWISLCSFSKMLQVRAMRCAITRSRARVNASHAVSDKKKAGK